MIYQELKNQFRPWSYVEIIVFLVILITELTILSYVSYKKNKITRSQRIAMILETIFIALILGTTVFTRESYGERTYELQPFWSWIYIFNTSDKVLLLENILNIILFVPLGLVLPFIYDKKVAWQKAFLFGLILSAGIECSQLILCRGLFEWDDMLHNSAGALLGTFVSNKIHGLLGRIKCKKTTINCHRMT